MDGAFFEAFATVDEKQKGSIKKAKQETKRQIETLVGKDQADGYSTFYKLFSKDVFTASQVIFGVHFLFLTVLCTSRVIEFCTEGSGKLDPLKQSHV